MSDNELARPKIGREVATTGDGIDITRGYTGPLLLPFDSVLRNRGNYDLQIYEQVLSDEEVKATLGQRQSAVTSCEWQVDAGGDRRIDKQAAEWLRGQLHRLRWDDVTTKMLFGVFYGYAVSEVIYGVDEGKVCIDAIKVRNRRRFRYGKDGELRMLTPSAMVEGVPCERQYFWDFCCGADHDDEPYGLGLAHWLYWPVLFKRNGIKFWLIFLEKFGMPTAVGRYEAEASEGDKIKLLQATRAIQVDSGIIMPKGMELDLLEAGRSGTADYRALFDTMNASIQKAVLGQTASTQGTPGKLGNETLQGDVRDDIIKADADLVCESFNQGPVKWLMQWNFPTAEMPRVYRVTEPAEDIDSRAERDGKIYNMGFKPTLAYVQETYGGEWTEKVATPADGEAATPSAISGPEFAGAAEHVAVGLVLKEARRIAADFASTPKVDPPAVMADRLAANLAPIGREWVGQVRELAGRVGSLEELREELLLLDLSLDDYADAMAEALTAAQLAGSYELLQELQG